MATKRAQPPPPPDPGVEAGRPGDWIGAQDEPIRDYRGWDNKAEVFVMDRSQSRLADQFAEWERKARRPRRRPRRPASPNQRESA